MFYVVELGVSSQKYCSVLDTSDSTIEWISEQELYNCIAKGIKIGGVKCVNNRVQLSSILTEIEWFCKVLNQEGIDTTFFNTASFIKWYQRGNRNLTFTKKAWGDSHEGVVSEMFDKDDFVRIQKICTGLELRLPDIVWCD